MLNNNPYTTEDGVNMARLIENLLRPHHHCALGGSLVYRGDSMKDIDIIIYPHSNTLIDKPQILRTLRSFGFTFPEKNNVHYYGSNSVVPMQFTWKNYLPEKESVTFRVDIFFMNRA